MEECKPVNIYVHRNDDRFINVLGAQYVIKFKSPKEHKKLRGLGGYTDFDQRLIVINKKQKGKYRKNSIRHEIIHAFLFESGLDVNADGCDCWARHEEMVDWFALQWEKIQQTISRACLVCD